MKILPAIVVLLALGCANAKQRLRAFEEPRALEVDPTASMSLWTEAVPIGLNAVLETKSEPDTLMGSPVQLNPPVAVKGSKSSKSEGAKSGKSSGGLTTEWYGGYSSKGSKSSGHSSKGGKPSLGSLGGFGSWGSKASKDWSGEFDLDELLGLLSVLISTCLKASEDKQLSPLLAPLYEEIGVTDVMDTDNLAGLLEVVTLMKGSADLGYAMGGVEGLLGALGGGWRK